MASSKIYRCGHLTLTSEMYVPLVVVRGCGEDNHDVRKWEGGLIRTRGDRGEGDIETYGICKGKRLRQLDGHLQGGVVKTYGR